MTVMRGRPIQWHRPQALMGPEAVTRTGRSAAQTGQPSGIEYSRTLEWGWKAVISLT